MEVLEKLYDIIYKEKILLDNFNWTSTKAKILYFDGNYSIVLNKKQINNSIEEKEIIAEELGHYFCNTLYNISAPLNLIKKCELRAVKWAYSVLVPYSKLKEKIYEGLDLYELSSYFEVDELYMSNCINFYINKYGLF